MNHVKRRLTPALAALGLACALMLSACGGSDGDGAAGGSADGGKPGADFKVAALLTGTENDGALSQAFVEGMQAAKREHGVEITTVGPVQSPDETMQQGAAFAQQGYKLVFVVHSGLVESVPKLAERFPDTTFCGFFDEDPKRLESQPQNVCYFDPEHQYGSFMGGVAAGLATKTGHVGAVVGMDIPLATRQAQGFHLGARCVRPDVKYGEVFTGDFNDAAKAKAAAEGLYGAGADILIAAVDSAVQGLFTVAEGQSGKFVVPQYFDNYDQAPKVVLTSVLFGLDEIAKDMIGDAIDGKMERQYRFTDRFSLADFRDHADVLGEENLKRIEEIRDKVIAGEIKVPDEGTIGKRGSGAKVDPASIGC